MGNPSPTSDSRPVDVLDRDRPDDADALAGFLRNARELLDWYC